MHVDDLPEGVKAEDTVTVSIRVEYIIERDRVNAVLQAARDRRPYGSGGSLTDRQQVIEEMCLEANATSWGTTDNIECSRGHIMEGKRLGFVNPNPEEKTPRDQWVRRIVDADPDMDCEECISEAEAAHEARYS